MIHHEEELSHNLPHTHTKIALTGNGEVKTVSMIHLRGKPTFYLAHPMPNVWRKACGDDCLAILSVVTVRCIAFLPVFGVQDEMICVYYYIPHFTTLQCLLPG